MLFDYEVLRVIWWALVGVLLIGFAVTDGFDMGVGALLPFVGRKDDERRVMINAIAPHWDGNQVWLITAGGAIFAAWPYVYATAFSGFYVAMVLTLAALFLRPVGFDYRSKLENSRWRNSWDWALCIGSAVPPIIFGVAFGNLLQGVPFQFNDLLMVEYKGSFWGLLNPLGLIAGVLSLSLFILHGATYLMLRTREPILMRVRLVAIIAGGVAFVLFAVAGLYLWLGVSGFRLAEIGGFALPSNPLLKSVVVEQGAWFANYHQYPLMIIAPVVGLLMPLLAALAAFKGRGALAFLASALAMTSVILTCALAMFPFIMPSSLQPGHSLTLWDATSSAMTLNLMLYVALIFVPIVLGYTIWCYVKMAGRLDSDFIARNDHGLY